MDLPQRKLRLATLSDFDALASWIRSAAECDRWAGPNMMYPFTGGELALRIAEAPPIVAGEKRQGFVMFEEHAPQDALAYGELVLESPTVARLARIIVARERRGAGLGRDLCRLLVEAAAALPEMERVRLFVYSDNEAALKLYTGLGFERCPPHLRAGVLTLERRVAAQ